MRTDHQGGRNRRSTNQQVNTQSNETTPHKKRHHQTKQAHPERQVSTAGMPVAAVDNLSKGDDNTAGGVGDTTQQMSDVSSRVAVVANN